MTNCLVTHRWGWATVPEMGLHTLALSHPVQDVAGMSAGAAGAFVGAMNGTSGIKSFLSNFVSYNRVTAAEVLNFGAANPTLGAGIHTPISLIGTGSNLTPPQVSVCVSLTAGNRPNGSPIRGRFYLPTPGGGGIVAGGKVGSPNLWQAFVNAWFASLIDSGYSIHVWSRKEAKFSPITQLRIGDIADTIRSRRNQLTETYQSTTYDQPPWTPPPPPP